MEKETPSPSILQLVGLVAISQIYWVVWFISFVGQWDLDRMMVVTNWAAVVSTVGVVAGSFWICPKPHVKVVLQRMRISAGTPTAYAAFIPTLFWLIFTGLQLRGKGSILLPYNPIFYQNNDRIYTYEIVQWFFHWTAAILLPLNFLWLTAMILVPKPDRRRIILLAIWLVFDSVISVASHHMFYGRNPQENIYALSYSSWFFAVADHILNITAWLFILIQFEKRFRPSLLPIVVLSITSQISSAFFQPPTDWFSIGSLLVGTFATWLVISKTNQSDDQEFRGESNPLQT
jgi:hypothetical protein